MQTARESGANVSVAVDVKVWDTCVALLIHEDYTIKPVDLDFLCDYMLVLKPGTCPISMNLKIEPPSLPESQILGEEG